MFKLKKVIVGINSNYETLNEAFQSHKRGRLHILLTSDILDEKDIRIPDSLKCIHIKAEEGKQIGCKKSNISIYCNGVHTILEGLGDKSTNLGIIGTERKGGYVSLTLKNCILDYVIGVHNVEQIGEFNMTLKNSKVNIVTGFLNHDQGLNCKYMEMSVENSRINILQGLNFTNVIKMEKVSLNNGNIFVSDAMIQEVSIVKDKFTKNNEYPIRLMLSGTTTIMKGII